MRAQQKGGAMTVTPTPLGERGALHRSHWGVIVGTLVVLAIGVALLIRHDVSQGPSGSNGVQGSGLAATQTRSLPTFSGVELTGSNDVTVRVGRKQSVVVYADDNLLRRVTTEVHAGSLVIGDTPGSFTTKSPMSVEVAVPSLTALTLSGSGIISVAGIEGQSLTVRLSGSGVLRATGAATRLVVTLAGSGDAQLEQLVARDVRAVVSGSGRILVTATNSLDASVPGSGAIIYSGSPARVTSSITGSGAVVPG
jgi:hypothetical protein